MRGLRSLLVLLVVLAGLIGYIYFVESRKPATPESGETKAKVFTVASDKIQELTVRAASGDRTVLKKSGTDWQVVEPSALAADQAEVSGLTASISSLEVQRVVEEDAADLKAYGLAEPKVEVGFKTADDKEFRTIAFGDKTATGGDMYAKVANEKRVILVSGYLESSFNKTTFDLRDKTILKFDRTKADAIELVTADRTLHFTKTGEDWKLIKPVEARADFGTVEGLVTRLQTVQMKAIKDPEPKDLKAYGLDKPEATATIGAGSARATLMVGKATGDGSMYARDAARPMVFTVESSLVDELKKSADDFRRKDLFEFRSYTATRVEIKRDTETVAFEKFKTKSQDGKTDEEKWRMVGPESREIDSTKMDTLLTKLSNMRAQSFTDPAAKVKTGLEKPAAVVSVRFDEGKKDETVTFGKVDSDVYAARPTEAGAAKLLSADFDDAMKALDDAKQKPEPKPEEKKDQATAEPKK